jgi:signal peptidase I
MEYNRAGITDRLSMKRFAREIAITVVLALIIFFVARTTIQTYEVFMTSMEPNFTEGDRVVVSKAVYWFGEPQRGDVIIFEEPNGSEEDFIKRVIGTPGDTVEIKNGAVFVNGTILDEPYIMAPPAYTMAAITVPENSYFVLGDNRNFSNDSHNGWFVDADKIHGKAWLITWPPDSWEVVPSYKLSEQITETAS